MKKVIISGASGFIGKNLIKKLLADDVEVTAIGLSKDEFSDIQDENLTTVGADFSQYANLAELIEKDEYDLFVHLAWAGYGKTTNDYTVQCTNVKATCDAIASAAELGCKRFVFSTSFSEYMIQEGTDIAHKDNGVCNVYGATKECARLLGQAVALQKGISMVSVALSNTFGPGDRSRRTPNLFISNFMHNKPVDLTPGDALYEWTFVDDTVDGLLAAATKGKDNGVYYIGSNNVRPLKDIVEDIKSVINPDGVINYGKYQENFKCDYSSIDTFELYRDTGFQAKCDFKESVLKTAEWLKEINFE